MCLVLPFCSSWPLVLMMSTMTMMVSLLNLNQFFSQTIMLTGLKSSMGGIFVSLSVLILLLSTISETSGNTNYNLVKTLLCVTLVGFFTSINFISFYVLFEASLIPTLALIIGWGYQPERLQAGLYFMMYTACASLPLLISLLIMYWSESSTSMVLSSMLSNMPSTAMSIALTMAFLVKLPLYGCHTWLPLAHVEAPLSGSMFLAGVLLKMGGYGIYMMSFAFNLTLSSSLWGMFVCSVALWGMVISSIICLKQSDLKKMVAFSSVAHMGVVVVGLFSQQSYGVTASLITMVGHALSSSALFCGAYYMYVTINSRSLSLLKGYSFIMPVMIALWFVLSCLNMSVPPSLNFFGEVMLVPFISSLGTTALMIYGISLFLSCAYNLHMFTSVAHGKPNEFATGFDQLKPLQLLVIFMHLVPYLLLFKGDLIVVSFALIMFY
uniref:NADH-ubiquinone oxidoreductase chain 4 n=2 Tax=unclassified Physidae TaxID=1724862 RepID=A0A8F8SNQ7_9GAST|nr:NADH dehydrogenase subunit 4 [Physidae sp. P3S_19]